MDIKKGTFLKDHFKLSSFSLQIYHVNAGNRHYASLRFCEFCPQRGENPLNSQSEVRLYWKIHEHNLCIRCGTCEVRRMNQSQSLAILFDKLSRIEQQSQSKYKSAVPNWFIRRTLCVPNLIIRFGTCEFQHFNQA